ncbi:MAG: DNA-processing protein DprA [Acutalibacteraceae bacterium]|nr:DNA-processing protein DprA [Acutalibacteraceae bacterium]
MEDTLKYWVWLQCSIGYANPKVNTVIRFYPSIVDFYNGGQQEWRLCGCFTPKEFKNLCNNTLEQAQQIIDKCKMLGYNLLTPDMDKYPRQLKEIYDPPAVLYVNGNLPDIDNILSIGIVGTRNATASGKKLAFSIGYDLAKSGVNVISGGALGIDSSSHKGALMAEGITVCVLGCGINYNYLMTNATLRKHIADNGAVISEYPPDTPPQKYSFPKRNRIISALSQGVLVVEAGEKSGALITATTALSQNKDIFAIPGDVTNAVAFGTNLLIKQGAKAVTNANEIIEEYSEKYELTYVEPLPLSEISDSIINDIPSGRRKSISINELISEKKGNKPKRINKSNSVKIIDSIDVEIDIKREKKQLKNVSEKTQRIYDIICENSSTVDDIIVKTGLPVNKIMQSLTELELDEVITRKSGGKYIPV